MSGKETNKEKQTKETQKKAGVLLVIGLFIIVGTFYSYQIMFTDNVLVDKNEKPLYIPTGSKFQQVADSLESGKFLHDRLSFMFLSKLLGYRDNIKPGRYLLKPNMNNFQLIRKLKNGIQDPLKVTIINIKTKSALARRLSLKLEIDSAEVYNDLNNLELLSKYNVNDTTVMAMILPNTYEVYWTWKTPQLLDMFKKEYDRFWDTHRIAKAQEIGLTPNQVIVMASIVEAETHKVDEKARIAGVYMNRLKADQRLQADPTLIFATQDWNARRINEYHRYFKSPYNTYRRKGLPPGPINIPSLSSIDAVLDYEKHDYLFFCAEPNLSGYHLFSKNFDEHLNVARDYWKTLDDSQIHQDKRWKPQPK
ncbi:MAG: endolytic transglycosylase MltG [Bacteroidota bacterium]|nr:endolytic transglycosylase MltG [Bacteroidota bacterium]